MREITSEFANEEIQEVEELYFPVGGDYRGSGWKIEKSARWWQVDSIADLKQNYAFLSQSPLNVIALDSVSSDDFSVFGEFEMRDIHGDTIKGELNAQAREYLTFSVLPGTSFDIHAMALPEPLNGYMKLLVWNIHKPRSGPGRGGYRRPFVGSGRLVST